MRATRGSARATRRRRRPGTGAPTRNCAVDGGSGVLTALRLIRGTPGPRASVVARLLEARRDPAGRRAPSAGVVHRDLEIRCTPVSPSRDTGLTRISAERAAGSVVGMVRPLGLPFDPIERAAQT